MTNDIAEIVPAGTLPEMLGEALFQADLHYDGITVLKGESYFSTTAGKELAYGHAVVIWDHDRDEQERFRFEISAGTHKDKVMIFNELEVMIDFVGEDDD